MNIAIGADHRGFLHKEYIKNYFNESHKAIVFTDVGAFNQERSDYPEYAHAVAKQVADGVVDKGILICGSGIGMGVAANRYAGIYAGVVWCEDVARMAGAHDNVNVLIIPSDFVSPELAVKLITAWLASGFLGGRYQKRIEAIDAIK